MSSSDMKFFKVNDARLNIGDQLDVAVVKGAAQITPAQRVADSRSLNSIQFNIDVPSLETVIDRKVYIKTKFTNIITMTDNQTALDLTKGGLASFPFHQMVNTIQLTTNSATTSINMQDWLPVLQRLFEQEDLGHYSSMCPTYLDYYSNYADAVDASAEKNPFKNYQSGENNKLLKRGAFAIESISRATVNNKYVYTIQWSTLEPVLISPLVFKPCKENFQGMFGVNTLNITYNLNTSTNRWFRTSQSANIESIVFGGLNGGIDEATLYFQFLTPSPDTVLPSQCVVPFYQLQSYVDADVNFGANENADKLITSKNITLNQIPDLLMVWVVDKRDQNLNYSVPDRFAPISYCKINFNNQDGILSGATELDLYHYSLENGLNASWQEYNGKALKGINQAGTGFDEFKTCGAPLVLAFGKQINIPQAYYAPGSIGQFNLQLNLTVKKPVANGTAFSGQLIIGVLNLGLQINSKGSTSYFTALLKKDDVLQANEMDGHNELNRMVGGAFFDNLKTVVKKAMQASPQVVNAICDVAQKVAPVAKGVADAMGSGVAGAGKTGGMRYRLK